MPYHLSDRTKYASAFLCQAQDAPSRNADPFVHAVLGHDTGHRRNFTKKVCERDNAEPPTWVADDHVSVAVHAVHVPRIPSAARDFLTGSADLTEGFRI